MPERPLASFNVDTRSGFDVWSAGKRPNSSPVSSETPSVNAVTRQSSPGMRTGRASFVGDAGNVSWDEEKQPANAKGPNAKTDDSATSGQQHALSEQLADDPAAVGTHRGANGQLALTPCRTREQQVGDVRARDQKHERDGAEQHQQRRLHLAGCRLPHRHDPNVFIRVHPLGVGFAKLLADDLHLRLRGGNGHSWRQCR